MAATRRSRMRRLSRGKRLILTSRDIAIFRALARYRYLRSTYLHAFAGGASEKRFKERLGDLFHEGYLDRPEAQWQGIGSLHASVVYELGSGARAALGEFESPDDERRVLLAPKAHRQFAHSLMICEVLASIELVAQSTQYLSFLSVGDVLGKAPARTREGPAPLQLTPGSGPGGGLVPDALFGLAYHAKGRPMYRFFALEADRGTMPVMRQRSGQSAFVTKLEAYVTAMKEGRPRCIWGVPNLLILSVTRSVRREANIRAATQAFELGHRALLFKTAANTMHPQPSILSEPWSRVGSSPLSLDGPD